MWSRSRLLTRICYQKACHALRTTSNARMGQNQGGGVPGSGAGWGGPSEKRSALSSLACGCSAFEGAPPPQISWPGPLTTAAYPRRQQTAPACAWLTVADQTHSSKAAAKKVFLPHPVPTTAGDCWGGGLDECGVAGGQEPTLS